MRPIHLSVLITVPLLLTACPDQTHRPPTPAGEVELDRSASVAGPDANGNGVRDDLDRVIARFPLGAAQKERATDFAAAVQDVLTTPMNRDAANERGLHLQRTLGCAADVLPDHGSVTGELFALTLNTSERVEAYLDFERNIGGAVINDVPGCGAGAPAAGRVAPQAAPADACAASGYIIAFFNGVANTFMDAGNVILALERTYGRTYGPNDEPMLYRRFYNPTEPWLRDLAEAFRQKERETPEIRGQWELIWQALRGNTGTGIVPGSPQDLAVQILRQVAVDAAKKYTEQVIRDSRDQPLVDAMTA